MEERRRLDDEEYERLLDFRLSLRTFLKWTQDCAAEAGLPPAQHQLLLAVRGHREHALGPTIGDIARYLLVKPHTATELVARAARAGLVQRVRDPDDGRLSRLQLTTVGETKLAEITRPVLEEISRLRPALRGIWDVVDDGS